MRVLQWGGCWIKVLSNPIATRYSSRRSSDPLLLIKKFASPRLCSSLPTAWAASSSMMEEEEDDDAAPPRVVETIAAADYLQQVMDAVSPFSMTVTEQHRKTMIRCLMGYHVKADFDVTWQNGQAQWQWEKASQFVSQHLIHLVVDPSKAPMFDEGIQMHQRGELQFFQRSNNNITRNSNNSTEPLHLAAPTKFFAYLARGRTYQGKLERLLADVAPEWVPIYEDILRPPNDVELFRRLMVDQETTTTSPDDTPAENNNNNPWKDQLRELVEKEFGLKPPPPYEDGGKQVGIQGELDMATYLQERMGQDDTRKILLTNVLVKPTNKHLQHCNQHNNPSKKLPHVIASQVDLKGATSEFDAMVVEVTDDHTIRIVELWEAKASLHPVTIYDGLVKKMGALQLILDDPSTLLYFYPSNNGKLRQALGRPPGIPLDEQKSGVDGALVFPFANRSSASNNDNDDAEENNLPTLGMFGMELMPPEKAAKKVQMVHCEALLEKDPHVVVEALSTGLVRAPDVKPKLQALRDQARRLQAMLVVLPSANS